MKPSPIDEVREMYDKTADSYAEMMETEIKFPVYADALGRLFKRITKISGALIDTACGSGHMLSMYRNNYDPKRTLVGIDLSPRMVTIAQTRLGSGARVIVGDMRKLIGIDSSSAAALLNWYAIHHLDAGSVREAMSEWHRVLMPGGQLLVAAWEGTGDIDYGDSSSIVAVRYSGYKLSEFAETAGFEISKCVVSTVEDFPMDAVYLECTKN